LGDAEVFHLQMKPQDEEKFELQPQLTHILLVVAALIFWAHNHVGSLRAMCALHKLKFDYITFIQRCTTFPRYRRAMDKDIWAVTTPDEAISPSISEPLHFANHHPWSKRYPNTLSIMKN
jgi:hypothetical protein